MILFSGMFSLSVWKSNGCSFKSPYSGQTQVVFFTWPFSNLVAAMVVSVFLSGNAMFFVKEISPDLLIASDMELSLELFTGPITGNITTLNLLSETRNKAAQNFDIRKLKKNKITYTIIFLIKFTIIFIKQTSFFPDARRFIDLF